jgi:alpha-tubulin suppressor-like RCC1 family protein
MHRRSYRLIDVLSVIGLAAVVGCGSGDPIGPDQPSGVAAMVLVSGNGQNAPVSTTLGQDFVVRVNDQTGSPVAGATVSWSVTSGGGSIAPTTDVTDASGLSQARLTLGPNDGPNTAQATITGLPPITFTATGTTTGGGGPPPSGPVVFRTIDAGSYHTCAITTTEIPYCWGFSQDGEVGNGATTVSMVPTAVSGGLNFRQISGGKYHSCAVTLGGDGYCWGRNTEGQLGAPVPVRSLSPILNARAVTFGSISVGLDHSCGLTLSGVALCWGANIAAAHQLGFVTETASVDTVGYVGTNQLFQRIASGGLHTCALNTANEAYCWGFNDQGQHGNGSTITIAPDTAAAAPPWVLPVFGGLTFDSITAGYKHTCGLTSAGAAHCWGDNRFGQLGDGTTTRSLVPVPVAGGLTFVALSAGFYHTCGITTANQAYCWGRNAPNSLQESVGGQLGDGTTTNRPSPTAVAGGLSFRSISAGEVTTCGITTSSVAYCWGDNEYGQLGTGDFTSSQVPIRVSGQL